MKTLNDSQTKLVTRFNNASLKIGKMEDTFRSIVILTFCNLDREQSEKAIQDVRDNHRTTANPEIEAGKPVPTFEATRKMINRILSSKTVDITWNEDHDLTLKTERSTGIVSFTTAKVKKDPDNTKNGNLEKVNAASKDLAKVAGSDFDDRLAAVRQTMADCKIDPAEMITYLFSGLTPQVQSDCILNLTAQQQPVLATKAQLKKVVNK